MTLRRHLLSAAIITLNEEKALRRCLESLAWVDEIVVVDAMSTDQTQSIALDSSAPWAGKIRFIQNPWRGFNTQRTLAMTSATHDWIFVVDADEACSPELKNRIEQILSEEKPHPSWKIRRQEYFMGRPIHHGVWNPSYQDRFFHRQGVRYQNEIHEYPIFPVEPLRVHEPLLHWPGFSLEAFLYKMNKYGSIDALERVQKGQRTNPFRMLTSGPAMFLKNYFYYRSWKDGIHGFVISILEGLSRTVRHLKMWVIQKEMENGKNSS